LPIVKEYENSFEITQGARLKDSFYKNAQMIGLGLLAGALFIVWTVFYEHMEISHLPIFMVSIANSIGIFLIVIALGYALVALPKHFLNWSNLGNIQSYCEYQVGAVDAEI
jgi:hypothetical protein